MKQKWKDLKGVIGSTPLVIGEFETAFQDEYNNQTEDQQGSRGLEQGSKPIIPSRHM